MTCLSTQHCINTYNFFLTLPSFELKALISLYTIAKRYGPMTAAAVSAKSDGYYSNILQQKQEEII
jgi:hypothetical protein